ncbi:MAG: DUF4398 domain-containing protein [Deltaproteobacteria bacterium]|nr:DUF4398 domain-containing protein [Deltaproteobacteria bacterium]
MVVRLSLLVAAGLLAAACGPVQSVTVIWEASSALEGARAADAQKFAPYEYASAELYLDKALEEQSYADFEPAIVFGTKATQMARKAKELAQRAGRTSAAPISPEEGTPVEPGGVEKQPAAPTPPPDDTSVGPVIVPVPQ